MDRVKLQFDFGSHEINLNCLQGEKGINQRLKTVSIVRKLKTSDIKEIAYNEKKHLG